MTSLKLKNFVHQKITLSKKKQTRVEKDIQNTYVRKIHLKL